MQKNGEINGCKPEKTIVKLTLVQANRSNAKHVANPTKRKIVGTEPTLPMIHDLSVTTIQNQKRTFPSNKRRPTLSLIQKTNYAAPALRGNSRREGVFNERSPYDLHKRYNNRMRWNSNRGLAETSGTRLHTKTPHTNRKRANTRRGPWRRP